MPPEEFVEKILVGQMGARAIVTGTDCGFGYRRKGDAALLKRLAPEYGYEGAKSPNLLYMQKKQGNSQGSFISCSVTIKAIW